MDPNTLLPMAYSIKVLSFPPLNGVVMLGSDISSCFKP